MASKPTTAKPAMPPELKERAKLSRAKWDARWTVPGFVVESDEQKQTFNCPFRDEDKEDWWRLVAEALGTVNKAVVIYSLDALAKICDERWSDPDQCWEAIPEELNTALAIMAACEPENEAQAALAMQMVTLHFAGMRLAKGYSSYKWGGNERTIATQARIAKTMAGLQMTLARLQGKLAPRQTNQTIQVIYVDQRDQRKQAVALGGGAVSGGQGQTHAPHGGNTLTQEGNASVASSSTAMGFAALPSPCSDNGATVSRASGEGQARLPDAWWIAWLRRTFRRA